jgi:hypothetical protein
MKKKKNLQIHIHQIQIMHQRGKCMYNKNKISPNYSTCARFPQISPIFDVIVLEYRRFPLVVFIYSCVNI